MATYITNNPQNPNDDQNYREYQANSNAKNVVVGILVVIILVVLIGGFAAYDYSLNSNPSAGVATAVAPGAPATGGPISSAPTQTSTVASTQPPTQTYSVPATATPTPDAPVVHTSNSVPVSNSTASVTGTVNPEGAPTTYWYEYGRTASFGMRTTSQSIGSGFTDISAPSYITGLQANTMYYYRLSAHNSLGTTNGETYAFTTNSNPAPSGSVPSIGSMSVSDIGNTSVTLNAEVNPESGDTAYWFEFGPSSSLGYTTSLESAGTGNSQTGVAVALANLNPSTTYYYRIDAQNQYGTVTGPIQTFTTSETPATTGISAPSVTTESADSIATSSVTLNGVVNPNGVATTYWFQYGQDPNFGSITGTVSNNTTLTGTTPTNVSYYDVANLANNTTYYYRLVAQNQYGATYGQTLSFVTNSI